jgi:virginiamycin B lyase
MSLRKLCLFMLAATVVSSATVGALNVQITEYEVPTANSRPHDPALAPDGALWYTGQGANKLGRLDPKTGEFKEFVLKTANSGPHGLVADKDGNIWFTAISGGYVGKLDPKTGEIAEHRPADGTKIDPHTPVFDHNGILWFTNEETNYIGRLDPKTGKMSLTLVPTAHAVPYGIVVLPNGAPFFCEFGSNKLGSIDPGTMKIREYSLPAAGAHPRRIALAPDGTIYYSDYARGYLGHFDPVSGMLLKEWMSPGGAGSEPYGIAVTGDGVVWYSESGVKPNTLVRFDPKSESFSTKAIPSGGGVVRNKVATPDRKLYLACSGVNRVAVVDLDQDETELINGTQGHGIEVLSDTQGVDFGPYLERVRHDVRENWYEAIPESAVLKRGSLAIEFAITRDGKVAGMKLVKVSGDVMLDRAAWAGIIAANPFPPLPSEFGREYLALRFHFYYNPGGKADLN